MADVKINITANNQASKPIEDVSKSLKGLGDAGKEAGEGAEKMGTDWEMALIGINSGLEIAQKAIEAMKKAYDFAREGAELEYLETKFDNLAKSIGTTSELLLTDLREATRGIMSDADLMKGATDMMALGLANTHDEAVRLAAAAGALGMNMDQLTLTLTNKTMRRFDTLGVSTAGFTEKVKALEAAGMSADAAFKEAFLQQAEEQIERVGHAADSAIGDFMAFESSIENITNDLKTLSASALLPLVTDLVSFMDVVSDVSEGVEKITDTNLSTWFWDINAAISPVYFILKNLGTVVDGIGKQSFPDLVISILNSNKALAWMGEILGNIVNGYRELYHLATGTPMPDIPDMPDTNAIQSMGEEIVETTNYMYDLGDALGITNGELEKMDTQRQEEMAAEFKKAADEAKRMAEQFALITSLEGNMRGIANLAQEYDKIWGQIADKQERINQLTAISTTGGYLDGVWVSAKKAKDEIGELTGEIEGLETQMSELANQVVLDMLAATIAIGGVTTAEFEAYMALGIELGKWSQEAADKAIETYGGAIDKINGMELEDKESTNTVNWDLYDPYGLYKYTPENTSSTHTVTWGLYDPYGLYGGKSEAAGGAVHGINQAAGGMINAAAGAMPSPYWVGEVGPEPFFPSQSGRILSNTEAKQAMRESTAVRGEQPITVVINTPFNFADEVWVERELAPYIRKEIRETLRT